MNYKGYVCLIFVFATIAVIGISSEPHYSGPAWALFADNLGTIGFGFIVGKWSMT
jgi:hypothetical protein